MSGSLPSLEPFLHPTRIVTVASTSSKRAVLKQIAHSFANNSVVGNHAEWLQAIFDREEVTSTGIGGGVALPHAQHASVADFALAIGLAREGIAFDAKDNKPVHIFVMMAAPLGNRPYYLKVLASIAARMHRQQTRDAMLGADSPEAVIAAFINAL